MGQFRMGRHPGRNQGCAASRFSARLHKLKFMREKIMKVMVYLAVLLMLASASGQCTRDTSNILGQVKTNGLNSLNALHDYVWVLDRHEIIQDGKGNTESHDWREQTVVANGKMYRRALQPGEVPAIPESEAALSSGYSVSPALYGSCGSIPCGTYPFAFLQAIDMPRRWDVRRIQAGELNGVHALVIDLREKCFPRHTDEVGTAWVDPEHCRLLRLIAVSAKNKAEEVFEFGEVKGNWLPVKREFHHVAKGKTVEYSEEYTYLKFGSSARVLP
jgi:hypothetical protein